MNNFAVVLVTLLVAPVVHAVDIEAIEPDLVTPRTTDGEPTPGRRVRQVDQAYAGDDVYHTLYLPTNWKKGEQYPVLVEYAGNQWKHGPGTVESSDLGYGISGGKDVIWVCLPFVDSKNGKHATLWWGDVEATVDYCKKTVRRVCEEYGGDSDAVFLAGFSRGSIACNYIGLHDEEIASLWRGFICHSHYDGVRKWGYAASDRASAAVRLKRLGDRPQFVSQENSVEVTRSYLQAAHPEGNFTFLAMSFSSHTDTWAHRDISERKVVREWFRDVLSQSSLRPQPKLNR